MKTKFDYSKYLVVGPGNCIHKSFAEVVYQAVKAGFTTIQIREKNAADEELAALAREAAEQIALLGKQNETALVINDSLSAVLKARTADIKVDGIHVGQSDTAPEICRKELGADAVIGYSAPTAAMLDFIKTAELSTVDYLGVSPLHPTKTKTDLEVDKNNQLIIPALKDFAAIAKLSSVPVVLGGGVKKDDLPDIAQAGIPAFFVVSAVCAAENPYTVAKELAEIWDSHFKA